MYVKLTGKFTKINLPVKSTSSDRPVETLIFEERGRTRFTPFINKINLCVLIYKLIKKELV